MADKSNDKKNPLTSLVGGLLMTILLVVIVPVVISFFIEPIVVDMIGDTDLNLAFIQLTSGAIGAIVMFIILVLFMLLLGGGAILRRFGIIGIAGLIIAYVLLGQTWGWVIPVIIVLILGLVSFFRDKKKGK
ncbi:MAG: hypothetical protein FWG60_02800 [Methanomassiliicoccaceae archaeon]|nr:hypothetical protein [Methanomassiliicoccaceae archaeon]